MNPFISWAILLVVAGSLGWYYTNGNAPKTKPQPVRAVVEKAETTVAPKKQKRKTKAPEPVVSKKPEVPVVSSSAAEDEAEDDVDNKEMARRLAAIKNGLSPAGPTSKNQKKKAKKATHVESSSHASSTGADADDDLSPALSPVVNVSSSAGYVSDMLEAPAPAASVLRVTGNVKSEPKKEKVQSFKQVETKKQRQQRLKNEARKEQVQEAEQERRKLLEKQLHTARESERREAARSQPASSNAWESKAKTNGTASPTPAVPIVAPAAPVQLLDTFEQAPAAPAKKWDQGLPSEEEQIRILEASNGVDDWTTISKKPKKAFSKATESLSETSAPEVPAAPAPVEPRVTVVPTYLPDIMRSGKKGHPLDSDWTA